MPETVTTPSTSQATEQKSKVESTHRLIHTISMTLGIIGAVGATGVWLAANFYVGDVEIKPDKPVKSLVVKVYDRKGGETSFHLNRFQLMPGNYHLEITPDNAQAQDADVEVKFGQKSDVPIVLTALTAKQAEIQAQEQAKQPDVQAQEAAEEQTDDAPDKPHKNHWWQFWRK